MRCTTLFFGRHLKLCLLDFLKMLDLDLSQIYTHVFHLWKTIDSVGQCLGWRFSPISIFLSLVSSRAFRDELQLRFRCGDHHQCLPNLLKMLLLALLQIYTRVFHLWKFIDLTVLKVAKTGLRAAWFLAQFPRTWAIFPSSRDSKLIQEEFAFQWIRQRKTFWTLGYEQFGRNIAT